ncbi:TIGR03621 family F420-dependent LLM class oxidoreductase [Micromonospora echinospora]|uniref:TIGR03621 family F420-dependent LLM class oxidoreductase n=1 Tax=Micromonospora echinospora TaxID=1877 RepID=UPI0034232EC6
MTTRPFRFGLEMVGSAFDRVGWRDLAREVEASGFSTLLLPDHAYDFLAPVPAMVAAADATTTLRVGTSVLANEFRHPAVLARDLATVAALTDGRLEVGIGAGWHAGEFDQMGIAFAPPGRRVERLAEAVAVLRGLLGSEEFSYSGRHYSISNLVNYPRLSHGVPPILVGGGGRRVLECAARQADIVGLNTNLANGVRARGTAVMNNATAAATAQKISWVREAAGDRFPELEICTRVYRARVGPRHQDIAPTLADEVGLSVQGLASSPHFLVGEVPKVMDDLQRMRAEFGISYVVVTSDALKSMAPVVAKLTGC